MNEHRVGFVWLRESVQTGNGIWVGGYAGYVELVTAEKMGVPVAGNSETWAMRISSADDSHEVFVPGCQVRSVEFVPQLPEKIPNANVLDVRE